MRRFIDAHDILRVVFRPLPKSVSHGSRTKNFCDKVSPLVKMIQILLAPELLSFNGSLIEHHYDFPTTQTVAYETAEKQPFFSGVNGLDVNMDCVLHQINFWKYHMVREAECTLFNAFSSLEADERPRYWSKQLQQGARSLGKHWKGSYAYVDRDVIDEIRRGKNQNDQLQDEFNGELEIGAFQDMRLQFVSDDDKDWPSMIFANQLPARTSPGGRAKTRAQHRCATPEGLAGFKPLSFRFEGEGHDHYEDFLSAGWLSALPAQLGVPGWQRMTMMKYFEDPDTGHIDMDALWAYEGVVLPGGQIIVGRWWNPKEGAGDSMYSGPFILWCVDGPKYDDTEVEMDDV